MSMNNEMQTLVDLRNGSDVLSFSLVHPVPLMRRLIALATVLVLLLGCENTIEPLSGESGFTIHGTVNVSAQRHFVRVRDLKSPLTADATRTLDATVTLRNVETGETTPMRDSVVAFQDVYTHNFWAEVDIEPATQYQVIVDGPDGTTTTATAQTPDEVEIDREPASGDCLDNFRIWFRGITELNVISTRVGFQHAGRTTWVDESPAFEANAPPGADARLVFQPERILAVEIPSQDNPDTSRRYEPRCLRLDTETIRIAFTHLGPAWSGKIPEGGLTFDPTESRFVENGLGFFGGLRQDTVTVAVDTESPIPIGGG